MRLRRTAAGVLSAIVVFSVAGSVSAQSEKAAGSVAPQSPFPTGTVSCFDYYRFGSVQAQLVSSVATAVSGTPITFTGTLENSNPYPIVDGTLSIKVFRTRSAADANGPDVVDQQIVKSDVVIPARGSTPVSFSWQIPANAKSGEYTVATFFTVARKFNLLGLTFTDDVVGNTVPFKVSSENSKVVAFDKSSVTVGGSAYHFASFAPRASATDPIEVAAPVRNETATDERVTVNWQVYQWDAQLRENIVQEETQTLTIPAGKSVPATITVKDTRYPVYLAVGTLAWKDTKSVVGIRFVRDGADRLRINFPSVVSYPLKAGQQNVLFSCLHNSGTSDVVPGGRLELSLTDLSGKLISSQIYTGDVTGAMMGVAQPFTPDRDYDSFVLDARLYDKNGFVDEAHVVYDCAALGGKDCSSSVPLGFGTDTGAPTMPDLGFDPRNLLIGGGVVLGLLLLFAIRSAFKSL